MIQVTCPECSKSIEVPQSQAGKLEICIHCGKEITIPAHGLDDTAPPKTSDRILAWAKTNPKAAWISLASGVLLLFIMVVGLIVATRDSEKDAVVGALLSHGWSPNGTPETQNRPGFGQYANQTKYYYKHKTRGTVSLVCCEGKILRFQLTGGTRDIEWESVLNAYRKGLFEAFDRHRKQKLANDEWSIRTYTRELLNPPELSGISAAILWEGQYPMAFLLRDPDYRTVENRALGLDRFTH